MKKTASKKTSTKKTSTKTEGIRIPIAKDAFEGTSPVQVRDYTLSIAGLGSVNDYSFTRRGTKHRFGKRIVAGALLIEPVGNRIRVRDLLEKLGVNNASHPTVDKKKIKAVADSLGACSSSRWATAAETEAYVKAERAFRARTRERILNSMEKSLRATEHRLGQVLKSADALESKIRKQSALLAKLK